MDKALRQQLEAALKAATPEQIAEVFAKVEGSEPTPTPVFSFLTRKSPSQPESDTAAAPVTGR